MLRNDSNHSPEKKIISSKKFPVKLNFMQFFSGGKALKIKSMQTIYHCSKKLLRY